MKPGVPAAGGGVGVGHQTGGRRVSLAVQRPQKGGRPSREVAGRRRVAAGVNVRPTGGREVSGRDRGSAAAGGAMSTEGRAAEPGSCRATQGRGGRERPPYRWAGGKRPGPGSAAAGGAASAEGRAAEPGSCRAAQGRGGRERPPYRWAGGKRPRPGERGGRGCDVHGRAGGRTGRLPGCAGFAAGVNARPTGGREVSGQGREGAAAGGAVSAEGQVAGPGGCRAARSARRA